MPHLCRDIILGGTSELSGIVVHVALGGWTFGTELQCLVPFTKDSRINTHLEEEDYCLDSLFVEQPDSEPASSPTTVKETANHRTGMHMQQVLNDFRELFTKVPGCTPLTQHKIDTGDSTPVNAKKHVTDNFI